MGTTSSVAGCLILKFLCVPGFVGFFCWYRVTERILYRTFTMENKSLLDVVINMQHKVTTYFFTLIAEKHLLRVFYSSFFYYVY